tara:strand:- start:13559 stop:15259 length:1701 start_codon:yes stop_codon:yes gene_type:complete
MNIETEIEWNSHIIKSGSVFGTYDFMISKGHTLTEMNYVIWGVEDNTNMPLIKAVASALDTHPDVLLKANPMSQAIAGQQTQNSQLQATDMNTRMDGQRAAGFQNPQPTGQERMQAGQPVRAAVAGARNMLSGGAYSQGKNPLNAPSPKSMKERYGVLADTVRHPVRAIGAKVGQFADGRNQKAAAKTDLAQRQVLSRLNSLNRPLTPKEQALHNKATRLIEGTADGKQKGTTAIIDSEEKSRNYGRRMRDIANAQWRKNNPDALSSEAPYPNELDNPKLDEPAIENPADGEQPPNSADVAAVKQNESEMNQSPDAMNDGTPDEPAPDGPDEPALDEPETKMPGEEGQEPTKVEGEEEDYKSKRKGFGNELGYTRTSNKSNRLYGDLSNRKEEEGYSPTSERTSAQALRSLGRGTRITPERFEEVLVGAGFTMDQFKQLDAADQKKVAAGVVAADEREGADRRSGVAASAAEKSTADNSARNPIDLDLDDDEALDEEELPDDDEALDDDVALDEKELPDPSLAAKKKEEEEEEEEEEESKFDSSELISSSDAIDSAWDYLTLLKGR